MAGCYRNDRPDVPECAAKDARADLSMLVADLAPDRRAVYDAAGGLEGLVKNYTATKHAVAFATAWIQVSSATFDLKAAISAAMASAGVFHPRVFLGLPFRSQAMSLSQV